MIYDILEEFKKLYEEHGDKVILDSYSLKDGLYVKINAQNKCDYFEVKTFKKEKVFSALNGQKDLKVLDWFKQADYYSSYLNSNKSLFDKKIHNINYLSLFFKVDNSEYVKSKMREHFLILLNFKKFKDKKEKEILSTFQTYIQPCKRKKDIVRKYKSLVSVIDEIVQKAEALGTKNYIKIFFEEDIERYKSESQIYLSLKIFNDIKYSQSVENKIYGLSNANMGLNAKKPYLEHKTRTLNIPFMIENENALLVKKFFDWLKLQPYNQDRTLDEEHFFIQKQSQNDEAEITEFDYIPVLQDDINKNFEVIEVKNYLKIKKDKQIVQDYEIKKLETLEEKVNELFYNGQLKYSYYRDGKDIKVSSFVSKELQTLLYQTKYAMLNYFKKYDDSGFYKNIKQYGTAFVLNHLRQGWELKAKEALNLKFALLEHYSKEHTVNIEAVLETLNKRLEEEGNYSSLSKEEFLFLSGQWAYYLLWYSKARDRTFALAEKYFRVKNLAALKTALQSDLDKYSHAINREAKRVKKTLALISAYDGLEAVTSSDLDLFLAGFSVDNIIFSKKNEEK